MAYGELGLTQIEFANLTWPQFALLLKKKRFENTAVYIQREILTKMINGIPVGFPKQFGRAKSSHLFPLNGETSKMEEMKAAMLEDPAFQPGMVLVEGKLIHRSKLDGSS